MRRTYSIIAWIIAGGVAVQAASIAFGLGGMAHYIQEGGVIDKALVESRQTTTFTGELGFPIHAIVGGMVIPLAALALLTVAFFVKVHGARKWAGIVLAVVALQITLGYSITDMPYLGLLHGANALAVLLTAVYAAARIRRSSMVGTEAPAANVVTT